MSAYKLVAGTGEPRGKAGEATGLTLSLMDGPTVAAGGMPDPTTSEMERARKSAGHQTAARVLRQKPLPSVNKSVVGVSLTCDVPFSPTHTIYVHKHSRQLEQGSISTLERTLRETK